MQFYQSDTRVFAVTTITSDVYSGTASVTFCIRPGQPTQYSFFDTGPFTDMSKEAPLAGAAATALEAEVVKRFAGATWQVLFGNLPLSTRITAIK
jgi:hypothetical protein